MKIELNDFEKGGPSMGSNFILFPVNMMTHTEVYNFTIADERQ